MRSINVQINKIEYGQIQQGKTTGLLNVGIKHDICDIYILVIEMLIQNFK